GVEPLACAAPRAQARASPSRAGKDRRAAFQTSADDRALVRMRARSGRVPWPSRLGFPPRLAAAHRIASWLWIIPVTHRLCTTVRAGLRARDLFRAGLPGAARLPTTSLLP